MAYRLRYTAWVDYVPQGVGLGQQAGTNIVPGPVPAGNQQTLEFFNGQTSAYPPTTSTFLSADVTTLTNAMAADLAAQMQAAAILARVQGFATGGG
jgi:hypothetical protein